MDDFVMIESEDFSLKEEKQRLISVTCDRCAGIVEFEVISVNNLPESSRRRILEEVHVNNTYDQYSFYEPSLDNWVNIIVNKNRKCKQE